MKNINYKLIKRRSNGIGYSSEMPRFNIGKRVNLFSGYQAGELLDTSQFESTPAQSFDEYSKQIRGQLVPTAISGGAGLLTNVAQNVFANPIVQNASLPTATAAATTPIGISDPIALANPAVQNKLTQLALNTAGSTATNAANVATTATTNTAANAAANVASNVITDSVANNALNSIISGTTPAATETATNTASNTAANTAGTTATTALKFLGPAMAAAGLVQGGIGLANSISSFSDPIVTSSAALNSMGKSTQAKYGEAYTTYTGLNRKSIEDVVDNANKVGKLGLTLNAASTGASTGALIGLAGGPMGSLIGLGIGGLIGFFGGLFGGESAAERRERRIRTMLDNVANVTHNYNTNEESEASSKGLRRLFSLDHYAADKGKDVYTNFGSPGKIKMVHTADGIKPGIELGVAGGKESIIDFKNQKASVIDEGKKRVDNISVGVPLPEARGVQYDNALYTADTGKEDWDNNVFIAGNLENPYTGNTIAEDAEPYARNVEKINKLNPMTNLGKKTKEINLRNQMLQLKWLSDVQSAVKDAESYFANCGKTPKYIDGKLIANYASMFLPHLALIGMLIADNTDYTPRSYNPYVASDYSKYINSIRSRKLNPSQAIKNEEKARLLNKYAIINQGGLSAGLAAALSTIGNLAVASAKNNIISDYALKNIALANEADRLGMLAAMSEAARKQLGNTNYYEWLMRSGSAANNLKAARKNAIYNQIGALGKDIFSINQYNQAYNFKDKIIQMYNKALKSGLYDVLKGLSLNIR